MSSTRNNNEFCKHVMRLKKIVNSLPNNMDKYFRNVVIKKAEKEAKASKLILDIYNLNKSTPIFNIIWIEILADMRKILLMSGYGFLDQMDMCRTFMENECDIPNRKIIMNF